MASRLSLESSSYALLLLPAPPASLSFDDCKSVYLPAFLKVLKDVTDNLASDKKSIVDVAVAWSSPVEIKEPRSRSFAIWQKLFASLYKVVLLASAKVRNNEAEEDRIDVRIFAVAENLEPVLSNLEAADYCQGPVVSLKALASSGRQWNTIYNVEGEDGKRLYFEFTSTREHSGHSVEQAPKIITIPIGPGLESASTLQKETNSHEGNVNSSVIVGGTFDHLHIGHKLLLTALALTLDGPQVLPGKRRMISVGITGDEMLKKKKYADLLESWDDRQSAVFDFLKSIMVFRSTAEVKRENKNEPGPNGRAVLYRYDDGLVIRCVEIQDAFGPTITEESITALTVSQETMSGGKAVNDRRSEKGWGSLQIFSVDVLDPRELASGSEGSDFSSKISSTHIRERLAKET